MANACNDPNNDAVVDEPVPRNINDISWNVCLKWTKRSPDILQQKNKSKRKQRRAKETREGKEKRKKKVQILRDAFFLRHATIYGQRLVDPLPFELLRLPSVNATRNYHSRHCRPLLSRLRIIIVLCGESSKKSSFIVDQDVGPRETSMNYSARSIRLVNRGHDYASYASSPFALPFSFSVCPRIN